MYILDTGFFVVTRAYYEDTFFSFWEKLTDVARQQVVSSVSEVKIEIEQYGGEQSQLMNWIKDHKEIFTRPSEEEQYIVTEIFKVSQNMEMLSKKQKLKGGPWADPFVIAKAKFLKAAVVTTEKPAQRDKKGAIVNMPKIPDICKQMNIRCISPKQFMQDQDWRF